ncbi:BrnT family toxin [Zooshikella harenae]|uniref:BrnT family toxin n=1 Tax=Zooshikella harenae TaxID=2827238 RepID=A0ABS5ZJ18_9GAMM|nr:BrnT family toxin [Zooshikella harenae]
MSAYNFTWEERFILLGMSNHFKTLVVCHCYRADDYEIRLISARRANKHEQKQYDGFRYA